MYPVGCSKKKKKKKTRIGYKIRHNIHSQKKVLENIPTVATSKPSWYRHLAVLGTKGTWSFLGGSSSWRGGATAETRPLFRDAVGTRLRVPSGKGLCVVPLGISRAQHRQSLGPPALAVSKPPPSPAQKSLIASPTSHLPALFPSPV